MLYIAGNIINNYLYNLRQNQNIIIYYKYIIYYIIILISIIVKCLI